MSQFVVLNSWALGDFARHFPQANLWDSSHDWEFCAQDGCITAYNFPTGVKLTFGGDGVINAEYGDEYYSFDDHGDKNYGKDAFVLWLKKKFPEVVI